MEKSQVKHGGKANGLRDLLHERGRRPRMRRIYVGKGGRITFFFARTGIQETNLQASNITDPSFS